MRVVNILGYDFLDFRYYEIVSLIHEKISKKEIFTCLNVNPHILNEAEKDENLSKNLNKLSAIFADGIGVYLASRYLYGKYGFEKKITGTDLYPQILSYAEKDEKKVFLFGGGGEASAKLEFLLREKYP